MDQEVQKPGYNQKWGAHGEDVACAFLLRKGFKLLARNFSCRWGELDLIFEQNAELVFVEVKTRRSDCFGQPEEAVTRSKIQRMTKAALCFVKERRLFDRSIRFDVISVDGNGLKHWPDAFSVDNHFYY